MDQKIEYRCEISEIDHYLYKSIAYSHIAQ